VGNDEKHNSKESVDVDRAVTKSDDGNEAEPDKPKKKKKNRKKKKKKSQVDAGENAEVKTHTHQ